MERQSGCFPHNCSESYGVLGKLTGDLDRGVRRPDGVLTAAVLDRSSGAHRHRDLRHPDRVSPHLPWLIPLAAFGSQLSAITNASRSLDHTVSTPPHRRTGSARAGLT